ncbi:kinase-like domain-containing protein [Fomitopsis serialis]|uniref:kinase-like domain-containing protein n=1 Tax=Fomitopsis serialis TaxID=139415 RepID=UPI002007A9DC|nr:kinase-like domain-containing protein [Neoantrodia serialis]KAH9924770.1 kinase-like domain-containing protein [Neoantrodia serialis]
MSSGSEICIWRPSLGTDNDLRGRKDKESERQENGRGKSSSPIPSPDSSSGRRGRSRTRAGYHTLMSSFGKAFHVEKRWKLIREMGSGAYGYVISAADEISGEPVAIKMVTRATEKVQLAKRALREITLLRHFNHENITGLIDVDCTPDLSEIYIFMEMLSNEHVQYFLYQVLRGMKYIHSASVVHRDLKPGNLLVNADCELKICDFGLSRGFNSKPDEEPTNMTEYVATRWYRAPEIMLAFKGYNTAIDVWSVGCIFGELMLGRPVFKGKDYGTPESDVVDRIASPKARAYIRSLPWKKRVPFSKVLPVADFQALDLLSKMLTFDPAARITVPEALEHPWLASYHDITDEPDCPEPFERWRTLEAIETLEQYKEALYNEIQDYRGEVRSIPVEESEPEPELEPELDSELPRRPSALPSPTREIKRKLEEIREMAENLQPPGVDDAVFLATPEMAQSVFEGLEPPAKPEERTKQPVDPMVAYSRRSSTYVPSRTNSLYGGSASTSYRPTPSRRPSGGGGEAIGGASTVAFPTQKEDYVVPARSRTASTYGYDSARRLLRTLSTVSIYESGEGFAGGLADIAPIGKYIVQERDEALPSEMPGELESPPKQDE